jgi:hypothetical protein
MNRPGCRLPIPLLLDKCFFVNYLTALLMSPDDRQINDELERKWKTKFWA